MVWLEEYAGGRVIAAQYHMPRHFYIVLNGSLACTYKRLTDEQSTTICFIEKGMCFGDLSLKSNSMHTSSLVSSNSVQLLVIQKDEFFNIFVGRAEASGLGDCSKSHKEVSFLCSLPMFKDWPKELFEENMNAITVCSYQRNQIITKVVFLLIFIYIYYKVASRR